MSQPFDLETKANLVVSVIALLLCICWLFRFTINLSFFILSLIGYGMFQVFSKPFYNQTEEVCLKQANLFITNLIILLPILFNYETMTAQSIGTYGIFMILGVVIWIIILALLRSAHLSNQVSFEKCLMIYPLLFFDLSYLVALFGII